MQTLQLHFSSWDTMFRSCQNLRRMFLTNQKVSQGKEPRRNLKTISEIVERMENVQPEGQKTQEKDEGMISECN